MPQLHYSNELRFSRSQNNFSSKTSHTPNIFWFAKSGTAFQLEKRFSGPKILGIGKRKAFVSSHCCPVFVSCVFWDTKNSGLFCDTVNQPNRRFSPMKFDSLPHAQCSISRTVLVPGRPGCSWRGSHCWRPVLISSQPSQQNWESDFFSLGHSGEARAQCNRDGVVLYVCGTLVCRVSLLCPNNGIG